MSGSIGKRQVKALGFLDERVKKRRALDPPNSPTSGVIVSFED